MLASSNSFLNSADFIELAIFIYGKNFIALIKFFLLIGHFKEIFLKVCKMDKISTLQIFLGFNI
jgi:hypothetical protein